MGKLKKGRTKVNPETQEIQYIPSRELSYEQLAEQDWQFAASGDYVEDRVVRAVCCLTEYHPLPEKQAFGQAEKNDGKIIKFFSIRMRF